MACQKIGTCKSCLGQCDSKELGYTLGLKQEGKKKGGLKAGTAASGDPFGESSRLADSYRKLMKVSGQSGEGPVESETEITEGQLSPSQIKAKDVHATFAAVAKRLLKRKHSPGHRYHVKRHFQSIRPRNKQFRNESHGGLSCGRAEPILCLCHRQFFKRSRPLRRIVQRIHKEISKVIVGHHWLIKRLAGLFAGGHVLLEGFGHRENSCSSAPSGELSRQRVLPHSIYPRSDAVRHHRHTGGRGG
jgi:hypothetical protein